MYHTKFHRLFAMSCVMVFSMVVLCISGCHVELYEKYETSDVDEYGVYQGHIEMEDTGLFSPLLVFPEKIADSAQDVEYYYRCACDALDNTYEVYLKCTYDKDTYEDEVKRLSQIRTTEGKVEKYIAYTEERFVYPAYVAIYDDYDCYEYALVNAEKIRLYMCMIRSKIWKIFWIVNIFRWIMTGQQKHPADLIFMMSSGKERSRR